MGPFSCAPLISGVFCDLGLHWVLRPRSGQGRPLFGEKCACKVFGGPSLGPVLPLRVPSPGAHQQRPRGSSGRRWFRCFYCRSREGGGGGAGAGNAQDTDVQGSPWTTGVPRQGLPGHSRRPPVALLSHMSTDVRPAVRVCRHRNLPPVDGAGGVLRQRGPVGSEGVLQWSCSKAQDSGPPKALRSGGGGGVGGGAKHMHLHERGWGVWHKASLSDCLPLAAPIGHGSF